MKDTFKNIGESEVKHPVQAGKDLINLLTKKRRHAFNYVNPIPAEQSFRDCIRYDALWIGSNTVNTVKEIAALSFRTKNLFETSIIHPSYKCRVVYGQPCIDSESDGIIIPLKAHGEDCHARLFVSEYRDIVLQVKLGREFEWLSLPVKSHQVKAAYDKLFPTIQVPNCPVE